MVYLNDQIYSYKINKTRGYVDKEGFQTYSLLRFDLGESDAGPDKRIQLNLTSELVKRYPPSYQKIKMLIAKKFGMRAEEIIIGPGLNEIIERIARVYLNSGDKCLLINPTFYRFEDSCRRQTENLVHIYLEKENNYDITLSQVEKILEVNNEKLIWICNPVNPSGRLVPLELIEKIVRNKPYSLVVIDEAYIEYVHEYTKYTALRLLSKYDNVIILRTLSKYYGLAGIRFGYGFSSEKIINALKSISLEFHVPAPSLYIAEQFFQLTNPNEDIRDMILEERKKLENHLRNLKNFEFISSSSGTILMRHKEKPTALELLKNNVLAADMNTCRGIVNRNYVRVTIQTDQKANDKLIDILNEVN